MEKQIRTVYSPCEREKIIEKSRFITYCAHVESEEEARAFVAEIRSRHTLATHVCYAFVADKVGNLQRFSDDGEPQGTAGLPILEVIKNKGLFETAVAVVRYFGGIKLGAGGLVRAYSSSTADALSESKICTVEMCEELAISVEYAEVDSLQKYLASAPCSIISSEYSEKVSLLVRVKKADREGFHEDLFDFMQGRVSVEKKGEYYAPFEE
jgi:uncharacterized YigZ family protein